MRKTIVVLAVAMMIFMMISTVYAADMNEDYKITLADTILALQVCTGAKPAGLVSSASIKITISMAIYTEQVISGLKDEPVWRKIKEDQDSDNDGTTDRTDTWTYDKIGRVTMHEVNASEKQYVEKFLYDAGGMIKIEKDEDKDNATDYVVYFTNDTEGKTVKKEVDKDNDGNIDTVQTYAYDDDGNMTEDTYEGAYGLELRGIRIYDANGKETEYQTDDGNDGTIDSIIYRYYDTNGNLTKEEADDDNNGTTDSLMVCTYDENGNRISTESDYENDGTTDTVVTRTYEADGKITEVRTEDLNLGINITLEYHYDSHGNVIGEDTTTRSGDWEDKSVSSSDYEYGRIYELGVVARESFPGLPHYESPED
ncbi:hypothetical protein QUF80_21265 [Desulfococcaceae bacterium HSG8]|nr:hypothetical protein [Desulfococcaceae bacterium HSG8]